MSIIAPVAMMKKVFEITPPVHAEIIQPVLYIRAGSGHFAYAVSDAGTGRTTSLCYYTIEEENISELTGILDQLTENGRPYYKIVICYDYPWFLLAPSAGFRHEDTGVLLQAVSAESVTVTELIAEWQMYNVYTVPGKIYELFTQRFPAAKQLHQVAACIKNTSASLQEGCLEVDIRHSDIFIMATRNGKLLSAQTFEYSTPEDVLFYLLRICRQFSLSQDDLQLSISGLVDKHSALYKELYQYFINIIFREAGWRLESEYPMHFFTSLNDLATCG